MTEPALMSREGPWRICDLDRLPDDGQRYEIVDGSLLVSPPPTPEHQGIAARTVALLRSAAPSTLEVVEATGVRIGAGLLIPDVLVVDADAFWRSSASLEAADVLLVVEIVSPSSLTSDRITKPALYAAARIAHYWRIETDGRGRPMVITYRLEGNAYAEGATVTTGDTVELDEPFRVTLIPSVLRR